MPTTIDASEIAARLPKARRSSDGSYRAACPHCDHEGCHRDNLYLGDYGYRCHRCGETGSFEQIAESLGIKVDPPAPVFSKDDATREIERRLGPEALSVLNFFRIRREQWSSGVHVLEWNIGKRKRRRILPHPEWTGPKTMWDKQSDVAAPTLYNLDECKGARVAWLVEGEMDVWTAFAAGVRAFCFTKGAGYEPNDRDIADIIAAGISEIHILYDADTSGERGSLKVAAKLASELAKNENSKKIKVVLYRWPAGTRRGYDLNDAWRRAGYDAAKLKQLFGSLRAIDIPPMPPGGFWWPSERGRELPFEHPFGYVLGQHGTYRIGKEKGTERSILVPIVPFQVWVEERYADADGESHAVMLAARIGRRTIRHIVPQSTIANASNIPSLSDAGFVGFTSANSTDLVRYLAAAQAANLDKSPEHLTVSRMGWRNGHNDERSFTIGTTILRSNGTEEIAEPSVRTGGMAKLFEQHRPAGTLEAEAECLPMIMRYPIVATLYLASMASALNEVLRLPPTIWQTAGESSIGKTSALSIARSPWGDPSKRALTSMNSTNVGIEIQLATHGAVACLLDEIKSHGRGKLADEAMTQLIYMISEGVGRTRGTRGLSLQEVRRWSCNVIMTGEHKITDAAKDTGVFARAYCFWGAPWGETSEKTAEVIRKLSSTLQTNHGHIGKAFVRHLMTTPVESLRAAYDAAQQRFVNVAPASTLRNFAERWAESYASLAIAGEFLEALYPAQLPQGTCERALISTWAETCRRIRELSYAVRAIDAVREYVAQRWSDIEGVPITGDMPKRREVIGRRTDRGYFLLPGILEAHLKDRGFSLDKALEHWLEEGWILPDAAGNSKPSQRVNGTVTRCVVIPLDVIEVEQKNDDQQSCEEMPL